jgi:hypothetical protein
MSAKLLPATSVLIVFFYFDTSRSTLSVHGISVVNRWLGISSQAQGIAREPTIHEGVRGRRMHRELRLSAKPYARCPGPLASCRGTTNDVLPRLPCNVADQGSEHLGQVPS